ncbi:MAG TPA: phytanoyl-CoA dioxygenase family protein [Chloroflexota bacterium]|nr:phytanoyl-CoA dioxygenase family protein [Chloroflexota bacterium]
MITAPGALSAAQLQRFAADGYLVVDGVLDPPRDLAPVLEEYDDVLDRIARRLRAAGEIAGTYDDLPFNARLIRIMEETGREFGQHFDITIGGDVNAPDPYHAGPAVFRLLTTPRLLDVVESVVGPEIFSSPVQHTRMKPPDVLVPATARSIVSKTPWHQDLGVVMPDADESNILTVWIPANEATVANGCLLVVPRSHDGGLVDHCPRMENGRKGLAIPNHLIDLEHAVPVPMSAGSVLLLTQRTMHASLANTTPDEVRISFDLRYLPVGQPDGSSQTDRGFVARSAAHPASALDEPAVWQRKLHDAWARQVARSGAPASNAATNRWRADAPACA